jgi:hypothetical protein
MPGYCLREGLGAAATRAGRPRCSSGEMVCSLPIRSSSGVPHLPQRLHEAAQGDPHRYWRLPPCVMSSSSEAPCPTESRRNCQSCPPPPTRRAAPPCTAQCGTSRTSCHSWSVSVTWGSRLSRCDGFPTRSRQNGSTCDAGHQRPNDQRPEATGSRRSRGRGDARLRPSVKRHSDARCSPAQPRSSDAPSAGQSVRSTMTRVIRQGVSATRECVAFGAR